MTFGPVTWVALAVAVLATIAWALCKHFFPEREWVRILAFGACLALGIALGPLVRLP